MSVSHAQLKAFHAVAVHGSFTHAAERLFLSQPAISDHGASTVRREVAASTRDSAPRNRGSTTVVVSWMVTGRAAPSRSIGNMLPSGS